LRVIVKECRVQKEWARGMCEKFGAGFEWDAIVDGKVASMHDRYRDEEANEKDWPDDLMLIPRVILEDFDIYM
jgi:hypothetical protein